MCVATRLISFVWGVANSGFVAGDLLEDLPSFDIFIAHRHRQYRAKSPDYVERRALYDKRLSEARRQNSCPSRRWTAGVNELWDWTDAELSKLRTAGGGKRTLHSEQHIMEWGNLSQVLSCQGSNRTIMRHENSIDSTSAKRAKFPDESSWKHLIKSEEILHQGHCGSCWAVASAKLLEVHAKIHGQERSFSAQQFVSCVPNPQKCGGTGGCHGATMSLAMDWVMQHSCAQEHEIPYLAADVATSCPGKLSEEQRVRGSDSPQAFGMIGWTKLPENQYEPLMHALVENGPVGVSVASQAWMYYSSGIFDGCGKNAIIDHAVVLVGYGHESVTLDKYWLVVNSWGQDWGEDGYMRLLRHDEKEWCGVDNRPEVGTGCSGGPDWVTVCGMCGIQYSQILPEFESVPAKDASASPQEDPHWLDSWVFLSRNAAPAGPHHALKP